MPDSEDNPTRYDLAQMTWREVKSAVDSKAIVILPVGATEAHGPHLPLETDTLISMAMSRRAAKKLEAKGVRSVIAPPVSYVVTDFAADFPGTISVSRETSIALLRDIGLSLGKQGFKTICIANSHLEPEHIRVLREVAEEVSRRSGATVCFPDVRRERWSATLTEEFRSGACHAGQYETSLILASDPNLVDEKARKGLKPNTISLSEKIKSGSKSFREAGGPDAYFGDPAAASANEGKTSLEALSDMLVTVVEEALAALPSIPQGSIASPANGKHPATPGAPAHKAATG